MGFLNHVWLWNKSQIKRQEEKTIKHESKTLMPPEITALYLGTLSMAGLLGSLFVDWIDKKTLTKY